MPRCSNRSQFLFPRYFSVYGIIRVLIDVGIIAVIIALFFVAMPLIIILVLLIAGRYIIRGGMRRYYGRRW